MKEPDRIKTQLPPCDVLREMIASKNALLRNGEHKNAVAGIGPREAWALYNVVLNEKPDLVVEIGMAQGVSTLSILCALEKTGGRLISIDPYVNWKSGKEAALYAVERSGYAARHTFMEEKSYEALPKLLALGTKVDLGYIDGSHAFEHAFTDFFYLDRMLRLSGIIGFNDAGWRSVNRVIQFLRTRRKYAEMDVGLHSDYAARNLLRSILRRLLRMSRQDRYFRKLEETQD